ncbi:Hypothetical predicted protein [Mytilus galloprovincialis]|uniref:Uncharacterized protein n=1 Tax=Mytilus galloprovincialis TaxID=29158 RepID=A0A8B6BJJ2_MYTGA|nr:Hypothetical predicted protein [Mytilus galloprovincialis]
MSPGFIWSDDSPALFQDALFTAEIQQRLDKFLKLEPIDSENAIDSASLELTDIIITAANTSLKRRKAQTGQGVKHQKWFDCSLAYLRKKLFSYWKIYSRFPRDPAVKCHFYKLQRLYTKARKHKYSEYKQSLLKQIKTLHEENPKQYWQLIDELQAIDKFQCLDKIPQKHSGYYPGHSRAQKSKKNELADDDGHQLGNKLDYCLSVEPSIGCQIYYFTNGLNSCISTEAVNLERYETEA